MQVQLRLQFLTLIFYLGLDLLDHGARPGLGTMVVVQRRYPHAENGEEKGCHQG